MYFAALAMVNREWTGCALCRSAATAPHHEHLECCQCTVLKWSLGREVPLESTKSFKNALTLLMPNWFILSAISKSFLFKQSPNWQWLFPIAFGLIDQREKSPFPSLPLKIMGAWSRRAQRERVSQVKRVLDSDWISISKWEYSVNIFSLSSPPSTRLGLFECNI